MVMRHINKELKLGFHRLMQLLCFIPTFLLVDERDEATEKKKKVRNHFSGVPAAVWNLLRIKTSFKTISNTP